MKTKLTITAILGNRVFLATDQAHTKDCEVLISGADFAELITKPDHPPMPGHVLYLTITKEPNPPSRRERAAAEAKADAAESDPLSAEDQQVVADEAAAEVAFVAESEPTEPPGKIKAGRKGRK
jgi:hypothetical protein